MHNPTKPNPPRVEVIPGSQPDPPKQNNFGNNLSSFLGKSAVGAAVGGLMNIASSAFNHHLAEKAAQSQYNRQLDFWNKQNEYNSPIEQRRRLQQAGLNPAVLAGDISGNNTAGGLSSVPGNDVAQRGTLDSNSLINSLHLFGQLESVSAGNDLMRRQIALSYADELIKKNEVYGIQLDNQEKQKLISWLDDEKKAALEALIAGTEETRARTGETKSRTVGLDIDNSNKQGTYDDLHRESEQRIRSLKLSNDLNDKYAELERLLDYDFKVLQGDLMSKNKAIAQSAADRAHLDRTILSNYGLDVESMDPLVHYPLRWVGAQITAGKSKDDPDLVKMMKLIKSFSADLVKYDSLTRDPDYISDKDRLNQSIELQKTLANTITSLLGMLGD